jgi:hypothetical protein
MIPKNPEHQPINKFVEPQIIRPFPKPILWIIGTDDNLKWY